MDKKLNILIRTSNRPVYFYECVSSIRNQKGFHDFEVNLIVGSDDVNDYYVDGWNPLRFERKRTEKHLSIDGAKHFPSNSYLNDMLQQAYNYGGWILFLDDDDLMCEGAYEEITRSMRSRETVIFWKVDIQGRIVPNEFNFGKRPVKKDISGIGFCFNTKYIPLIHIAPFKQMDYRLADQLYSWCEPVWIDKILTKTNNEGQGLRKDKNDSADSSMEET